jgi:uncharacterized protein YcfJ
MTRTRKTVVTCLLLISLATPGCASKTGTGAIVGGVGGAAVGGLIGSKSHARAGEGALIGGAVGAIGGALVGNSMDNADQKKAREQEQERSYQRYRSSDAHYDRSPAQ